MKRNTEEVRSRRSSGIRGLHHVSLKCGDAAEFLRAKAFYTDVLGLRVWREWNEGVLIETGAGYIEIFCTGEGVKRLGAVRHFAFACDDVDSTAAAIRAAGYEIFVEPRDIVLPAEQPVRARIAFCRGPLGEEIEFFDEKDSGAPA